MKPGLIVLFGSGETSPTGRRIHDTVFRKLEIPPPINIGILETPTGYEVNAIHGWPERLEKFFVKKLQNYKPHITRIRAWRKDGPYSTNNPLIAGSITKQDYLYCGAGAPGYTVTHLKGSLAYKKLIEAHNLGTTLCLGSASAIALGQYALPVYEIFKSGQDLHWINGLHFFAKWKLNLAIIPHWNNQEGEDFDTTRCWMGEKRFSQLEKLLPHNTTVLGIDEETACVFDIQAKNVEVLGVGSVHIVKNGKESVISNGSSFSLSDL